jgi:hypothetical protein
MFQFKIVTDFRLRWHIYNTLKWFDLMVEDVKTERAVVGV